MGLEPTTPVKGHLISSHCPRGKPGWKRSENGGYAFARRPAPICACPKKRAIGGASGGAAHKAAVSDEDISTPGGPLFSCRSAKRGENGGISPAPLTPEKRNPLRSRDLENRATQLS